MFAVRLTTLLRALLAAGFLLASLPAGAQVLSLSWVDPALKWRTLETPHFYVHFAEPYRRQANLVAGVAEGVYPRITRMLSWEPRSRTHVVVLDSADFSNGFASPLPFNYAGIWLSPPDEGELLQNREWLELVMTHEFTHIVHLDKARGAPLGFRNVFGRIWPFFPNALQPDWVIEGLAVYSESDKARGYGRLEQSFFEGMMRAERERGLRSLREVNAEGRGFPLNRDYLYGGYFFAFLRERYGEAAIARFIEDYSDNIIPFRVHSNPVNSTGKPMDALWEDYHAWLRTRFGPSPGGGTAEEGEVVLRAFSVTAPALTADGSRWYVQADGYTRPRLMRQPRGGEPNEVRQVESGTRLATGPEGSLLVSQQDICGNYNLLYDLYTVNARNDWRRVTRCGRDRFAAQLDDGRFATIRVTSGEAQVVLLDPAGAQAAVLYRAAPGESLTGLAAKGMAVVVTSLRDSQWSLIEVSDGKPSVLVTDEAVKHSPRFGESADQVYFIADYGKVFNVWSVERASKTLSRWTNARNGVREAGAPLGGELLLTTIEADGVALRSQRLPGEPFERRTPAPAVASAAVPAPIAGLTGASESAYSPWSSLRPRYWLPLAQVGDGAFALGVATSGQDALGLHQYVIAPLYEFTQHEVLGTAAYVYDGRHSLLLDREMLVRSSDAHDGVLDRKITSYTIRQQGQWVSTWRYLSLDKRFYWGLGAAVAQERLYFVDDGMASLHNEKVVGLVGGLDTRRQQFLSEGPSQGTWLQLFAETSNGLGGDYTGNAYRSDWRAHLPLWKTVLSGRWNEAYSQSGAQEFQLGGATSDEYFDLPVLNQRQLGLRGYSSGEPTLRGHHARVVTGEWRLPLADVDRSFMVPPVGLNRISMNVFAEAGAAWNNADARDYHRSVGMELMTEPRLGYLLGFSLRLGVARGLDEGGFTQAYLRGGRSF